MSEMPTRIWAWLHPESTWGSFVIVASLGDKRYTEYIRADLAEKLAEALTEVELNCVPGTEREIARNARDAYREATR